MYVGHIGNFDKTKFENIIKKFNDDNNIRNSECKEVYPIANISRIRMGTDGKGIRTLVLLSGCPLRCKYCLNPMTWNGSKEPEMMTAREVYCQIMIDRLYMLATGGGITFGGGEPLEYPKLINEVRKLIDPELTIDVETSLNVDLKKIEEVVDFVNVFVVDIKSTDPKVYKSYTGGELAVVLNNLKYILDHKTTDDVIVRIPLIDGYTTADMQRKSQQFLYELGVRKFDLFEYITV